LLLVTGFFFSASEFPESRDHLLGPGKKR